MVEGITNLRHRHLARPLRPAAAFGTGLRLLPAAALRERRAAYRWLCGRGDLPASYCRGVLAEIADALAGRAGEGRAA